MWVAAAPCRADIFSPQLEEPSEECQDEQERSDNDAGAVTDRGPRKESIDSKKKVMNPSP